MTFDEIRDLLAQTALQQKESSDRLTRTEKIVESNACAVEANASAITELRQTQEIDRADFRASIEDLVQMATESAIRHEEHATFIRGLQRENRQILRELRDRRNPPNA